MGRKDGLVPTERERPCKHVIRCYSPMWAQNSEVKLAHWLARPRISTLRRLLLGVPDVLEA